jgi:hypothetical protein
MMISCYPGDHKQNQFRVAICVEIISIHALDALVAQLDRVPGYEPGGQRFESSRARHFLYSNQLFTKNRRSNFNFGYGSAVFLPSAGFMSDCLAHNQVVKFKINSGLEPKVRGSNHLGRAILRMAASDERRTTGLRSNDSSYSELNEQFIAC